MGSIGLTATTSGAQETTKNILSGINVQTAPVHVGNAEYEELTPDDSINVTVGMFFDGTGNNRKNTESRLLDERRETDKEAGRESSLTPEEEEKADEYRTWSWNPVKLWNGEQVKKYGDDSSYENDYSNVSRLEEYYDDKKKKEKHKYYKVYVEGIGTTDGGKDGLISSGTGLQGLFIHSGVRDKVLKSCELLVNRKIKNQEEKKINTLTIDVYGFSRGAAAARNFLSEIHKKKGDYKDPQGDIIEMYSEDNGYLGELLAEEGITFRRLDIRFVGLYDCVASHGMVQFNDVRDLGLDAIKKAKHVFHLVARDEHRFKFSLTNIDSANTRGLEKSVPGVHSDIGGCYVDAKPEKDIWLNHESAGLIKFSDFEFDKNYLKEQGWYNDLEFSEELKTVWQTLIPGREKNVLLGNRKNISNQYSYITLSFMAKYAIEKKVEFKSLGEIESEYSIKKDTTGILKKAKDRLSGYVFGDAPELSIYNSQEDKELLTELRSKHFHFSANYGAIGMFPEWKGKYRARTIYSDAGKSSYKRPLQYREFNANPIKGLSKEDILQKQQEQLHIKQDNTRVHQPLRKFPKFK